jgi:hypothetical protein
MRECPFDDLNEFVPVDLNEISKVQDVNKYV